MHPSIGTWELAYAVGSKLMDVRFMPNENDVVKKSAQVNKPQKMHLEVQ